MPEKVQGVVFNCFATISLYKDGLHVTHLNKWACW